MPDALQNPRNARLWVHVNTGWVKLTLRPGQVVERSSRGPTDEGWSGESERWEYDGEAVRWSWLCEGRDCDGYSSRSGESSCAVGRLQRGDWHDEAEIVVPDWKSGNTSCRDEYAEAAGY